MASKFTLLPLLAVLLMGGCVSQRPYTYQLVPGRTAELRGNVAVAPAKAPDAVQAAIAAGNQIAGLPYARGGGHRRGVEAKAYDCSGAASYVLREAGLLADSMPSRGFRRYGERGPGKWISIYARKDHVFLVIAGLRFDTGYTRSSKGPRWTTNSRPTKGAVVRHPRGL